MNGIILYGSICYSTTDTLPSVERSSLPSGTNVLETGDFGRANDCTAPVCGSNRLFVKGNPCGGQGSPPDAYWCRSMVVECRSVKAENGFCYLVSPDGEGVDEDNIPSGALKYAVPVGDPNAPPTLPSNLYRVCCECVDGCSPTIIDPGPKCGLNDPTDISTCCCDELNYTITQTFSRQERFASQPDPPNPLRKVVRITSTTTVQTGIRRVVNGVVVQNTPLGVRFVDTFIDFDGNQTVVADDVQYSDVGASQCAPAPQVILYVGNCPATINPATGFPWGRDQVQPNGNLIIVNVFKNRSCGASGVSVGETVFASDNNSGIPDYSHTESNQFTWEGSTTGRCTGGCSKTANASVQAFARMRGLSTQQLADILRRA